MKKKVAILQSNYIPWKGYFDLINLVDEFIFYDDMQYTRRDWRNRNKIKTAQGLKWLTVPVEVKGKYFQKIRDTKISDKSWCEKHWNTLKGCYSKAPFFNEYSEVFKELYMGCEFDFLSEVNYSFIHAVNNVLGISTKISWSSDYLLADGKTERLVDLCRQAGATEYISGPAAKCYVDAALFKKESIKLSWMEYSDYPEYKQLYGDFEHGVTVLDLIFNTGADATKYMKGFSNE